MSSGTRGGCGTLVPEDKALTPCQGCLILFAMFRSGLRRGDEPSRCPDWLCEANTVKVSERKSYYMCYFYSKIKDPNKPVTATNPTSDVITAPYTVYPTLIRR